MCGISALFSNKPFSVGYIEKMSACIRHRGPDDEGFFWQTDGRHWQIAGSEDTPLQVFQAPFKSCPKQTIQSFADSFCTAALGHRRLSILDLSAAGHQPMSCYLERFWITYNGEIYNFLEIRQQLIALGVTFSSQTDTEVVLKAYCQWGKDCLKHFNGMFAFIIFDRQQQTVFAARDRFGVKPLYYWLSKEGTLAFASEIKQFTFAPGWQPSLNIQRSYDFLNWGLTDHTHETLFKDVYQLRGGEYLLFNLAQISAPLSPQQWYKLTPSIFKGTLIEAAEEFEKLLTDSIRLRLRSDVALGACLSGGLDSSSIVCLMRKLLGKGGQLKTFSACSTYAHLDERAYIERIVAKACVDAHYVYPDVDQLLQKSIDILWHQDEPFPTTSMFAQWLVFKLAKDNGVKVVLDGQGADEQLAGYQGFFGNQLYDLFKSFQWRQLVKEAGIIRQKYRHLNGAALLLNKLVPDLIRQPIRRALGKTSTRPSWINLNQWHIEDRYPCVSNCHSVQAQSMQQLLQTSLPMLLRFEDRNSMAHSIESRTPFLDYRLVEFTLGLTSQLKVHDGWTKYVMRKGLNTILPSEICWRTDKMGFVTAEEEWVCRERPAHFEQLLQRSIQLSQGILNDKAMSIAEGMFKGKRPYHSTMWRQICFGQWLEKFKI